MQLSEPEQMHYQGGYYSPPGAYRITEAKPIEKPIKVRDIRWKEENKWTNRQVRMVVIAFVVAKVP